MGSGVFSDMASNNRSRNIFVKTTVQFLRNKKFDGLGKETFLKKLFIKNKSHCVAFLKNL